MPKRKLPPNEELITLYNEGLSASEVADRIGANKDTVASMLNRLGVTRPASETHRMMFARGARKSPRYWLGKKQPKEMVEKRISKIRGENHWLWKGGTDSREYRKLIKKEHCSRCGKKEKLAIHHKDSDHYNNAIDNLEVLCASCHQSIHKKQYWDAIHAGEEPPKSNAPIRWNK